MEWTDVIIQYILVAIIVSLALIYAIRKILLFFKGKTKKQSSGKNVMKDCESCEDDCDGCPVNSSLDKYYQKSQP